MEPAGFRKASLIGEPGCDTPSWSKIQYAVYPHYDTLAYNDAISIFDRQPILDVEGGFEDNSGIGAEANTRKSVSHVFLGGNIMRTRTKLTFVY
jgi:hypothetical protein